jgi:glutamyl-tRNA(Gln) amidotransferase subunit D
MEKRTKDTGKLVYVITTGGTINTFIDKSGVAHVGDNTKNLVSRIRGSGIKIETRNLMSKGSASLLPSDWALIAKEVGSVIKTRPDVSGIVILHGTDTMHYTAAALSFMVQKPGIPIVLTGSMISGSDESSDAISNFNAAVRVASKSNIAECVVVFSANTIGKKKMIIRGCRARKINSVALNAFDSINSPPLAFVDEEDIHYTDASFEKRGTRSKFRLDTSLELRVVLIKQNPALSRSMLRRFLRNARGAVIEGTGRGHINESLIGTISEFNGPIVVSTQALYGGEGIGTYDLGRKMLGIKNIIPAGDMPSETAFVKLMWCLGHSGPVRKMFLTNFCSEFTKIRTVSSYSLKSRK